MWFAAVTEHLTASLEDEGAASDSRLSTLRDEWVARMVRFGSAPILVAALLHIFEFHYVRRLRFSWTLGCVFFNAFLAGGTLSLTFTGWFDKNWRPTTFLILAALVSSNTVLGTVGREPKLLFISSILLMVGTGALLPWPRRVQVCFNLLCLTACALQSLWIPSEDGMGAYKLVSLLTAAGLSWFTCYVRDRFVREHAESERISRESERTLREMFDANTDCITLTDAETRRFLDVNESFIRTTGYSRDEVMGATSDDLKLWTDSAIEAEYRARVRDHHEVRNMEVSFRLKDGTIIPSLASSAMVTVHGRPCVMTLARDITDLRKSQEELRESEQKFRLIFEAGRDALMVSHAADGKIVDVNPQFSKLSGFTREEVLGRTPTELGMWAGALQQREAMVDALIHRGYVDELEVSLCKRNGDAVPVRISAVAVNLAGDRCYLTVAHDISRLRKAEQKIRQSEATLRKIFDATLDWMSICDMATGEYLDINESFARSTGYSREEIIGSNFFKLGVWPIDEEWQAFVEDLVVKGAVHNRRATFRTKEGRQIPSLISAVQCELWGRLCTISTARDIGELVEAQEKVRCSEEKFRVLFDTSLDAMSISDATGAFTEVNPEFLRATGYSREELIGRNTSELNLWESEQSLREFLTGLATKGEVRNLRVNSRCKDGTLLPSLISGVIADIDGQPYCLGVSRDISELTAAQEKVRKSETMMRTIFDASLDSVALIDLADQTIVEVNSELVKTIGYSRNEMIGRRLEDLMPTLDPIRQNEVFSLLMQGREVRNFELMMSNRGRQRTFPVLVSASVVEVDGRTCALSASRDITDLVNAREAALAASKAKSEFVSIMSHEIRTPMNAILGMADLIGDSELNLEQRRYLDTILSNGNALLDLINSILDLAKIESGRLSLEDVDFHLIDLIEHAADTLAIRAYEKEVELAMHLPADLPLMVTGDSYRLRQILNNLIGNAIKFTNRGEVLVSLERNSDLSIPGNFRFSIRDTGIGIAPEKLDAIFSVFTQADTSTTRKFGGSGLGLAIVQRLVGLMGGRVWVESEPGKGSTFHFTVDLRIADAANIEAQTPLTPELAGVRALTAIVNPTVRAIVSDVLRAQGAEVIETSTEAHALATLAACGNSARFKLLLIDAENQSGDGADTLRHILAAEPDAPIVVLTNSNGLPATLRRMREHGLRYYLAKPIKRRELFSVIAEALSKTTLRVVADASRVTPSPTAARAMRPLKILLADDSPDNRLLIRAYTKKTPYILTETENGQLAVDHFMSATYDLVLMDIQMPVLDGYGAVRAIRKWEQEKGQRRTPIIALTAAALEEDVRRAKEAGCDLHVSKPVKKSTLLEAVANAVASARCDDPGEGAVPPAAPAAVQTSSRHPNFEI